ncbi:hypothetical protein OG369_38195 [Streptomyces sp. NBC_01221]|uniref:hypothetical protein n=1 Tax=Streptomyces sp. NBC_01221 TaxID=2903782 RepID=UPI002252F5D7|nr:hypothetical protein [Streptomyces sp. NBC_01221]MCX4791710.1 hypothetical protein [Streptomyces sp. NBC_01221]
MLVARLLELDAAGALTSAHVRAGAQAGGVNVRTVWRWLDAARTESVVVGGHEKLVAAQSCSVRALGALDRGVFVGGPAAAGAADGEPLQDGARGGGGCRRG